ncbi:MAG: hypothetical protein H6810_09500 [Phycisphaeraceae bacterium]|nr:MAG: hypothetical protein H6810_09500 [Phycisphaeraceae bacterium]
MSSDRGDQFGDHRPLPREEVDRLLDRELTAEERRAMVAGLRRDARALDELVEMRRLAGRFHEPISTPDLTDRILHGVEQRRGFLSSRLRRRVKQGRTLVGACALLSLFLIAVAHRVNPDLFRLHAEPTPVADLDQAVVDDSIESKSVIRDVVRGLEPAGLISGAEPVRRDPVALPAIHIPELATTAPAAPPERYITLTACADAEVLALGGSHSLIARFEITTARADDASFAACPVEWPVDRFASLAVLTMQIGSSPAVSADSPVVAAGVVPLSVDPGVVSAYVGRFDPLGRSEITVDDRANPQPNLRERVSSDEDR